jgi:hypothetical protein
MTFGIARGKCRDAQCLLGRSRHGEYIVTPLWNPHPDAKYYATDLDDAVNTAAAMHEGAQQALLIIKNLAVGTPLAPTVREAMLGFAGRPFSQRPQ